MSESRTSAVVSYFNPAAATRTVKSRTPKSSRVEVALDEDLLIRRARSGNQEAFTCLVDRHAPIMWTVINRMTGNSELAKDLFQETVIRFWKGLSGFQGASKLSTWLYRIAYRVCLDSLDSANMRLMTSLDEKVEVSGFEVNDESTSGHRLENKVAATDAVSKALDHLRPEWKMMIMLYYWREFSVEEVAEVTGRPVNTVKVYLHRARAELRQVLEDGGYPSEGGYNG
ncbi:MAG TPA: RNA polymerase sigma factor [Bacteroidetes bacterium]|nr:RNA polymerase sigma factor [Bacteroidota bacterium]HEX05264.1 RNA polymerase sigma factor [Bacteroidota bacterium]